ncbi:histidine kinase [Salinibacterium sp. ZJ454]|uniref:sensor histidine kinase n=1 Tax=Salinibacterium sp. ZJ454 TaxID=2708339 RepID=UPI00141F92F1|nr:histidine kinase [Salinibacterium sp. ZJ454]
MQLLIGAWPAALMLADVCFVPMLITASGAVDEPSWPAIPFLLLVVLPIVAAVVLRNRFTVSALLGTAALIAVATVTDLVALDRDGLWLSIAAAALSWSAARAGTRRAGLAWLVFAGTILTLIAIDTPDNLPIQIAMIVLPFGAAAAWSGQHAAEIIHLGEAQLRQAQIEAAERAAVSDERLQLARDLHDAASHAVGTMMMQANAARVLRERDPDAARAALDAIIDIGREASVELRTITTPPPGSDAASLTSQPTSRLEDDIDLADGITPLIAAARRAGAQVTTVVELTADAAPEDARLLLRVIREGLANAVRHAPGSDVTVQVCVTPSRALASVTNGPARPDPRHNAAMTLTTTIGSSLGLRGLRELVGERHGELSAGATGSGFVLTATFPVRRAVKPAVVR